MQAPGVGTRAFWHLHSVVFVVQNAIHRLYRLIYMLPPLDE